MIANTAFVITYKRMLDCCSTISAVITNTYMEDWSTIRKNCVRPDIILPVVMHGSIGQLHFDQANRFVKIFEINKE